MTIYRYIFPKSTDSSISNDQKTSDTSTCMQLPILELLHLSCLKTPLPAGGFAMIGGRLSRERILTFVSFAESSSSIFSPSKSIVLVYCNRSIKENAHRKDVFD